MRDPVFETELLALAAEGAQRVFHARPSNYTREVLGRMEAGARTYGDTFAHDGRDLIGEAMEEGPDVSGYVLLELQRLRPQLSEQEFQELKMAAAPAMAAAAASFAALLELRAKRDELCGG